VTPVLTEWIYRRNQAGQLAPAGPAGLVNLRVGLIERRHPPGHRGSLVDALIPTLAAHGAVINVVHAEEGGHRLDVVPAWDVVVLKSGSAAALHLAAAAEAWSIPDLNSAGATRLAQDKLASSLLLAQAGVPIAPSRLAWLGGDGTPDAPLPTGLDALADRRVIVKAARGSQGVGLWSVAPGDLAAWAATAPPGPYLLMDWVPHAGDDLKVFVAGPWMTAIERPFPARTLAAKQGRPVALPASVATVTAEVGALLGLSCYGCDFIAGPGGWMLVDVNAFPGYKGAVDAPAAIAAEIGRVAAAGGAK
jgi:ribosomal protein S6--L-glutamate ligase